MVYFLSQGKHHFASRKSNYCFKLHLQGISMIPLSPKDVIVESSEWNRKQLLTEIYVEIKEKTKEKGE